MRASEIRSRFLAYFERHGHAVRPSSSLVPEDDPTLLFVNAGMVPFKKVFLGLEEPAFGRRASTAQKCVRAGGKHNDLEQVGHTARHLTFFEMLGNFSFGDYFKRDAIRFAWEFVTKEVGLKPEWLRVSVFHEDDEARALWREIAGLPDTRIYSLGAKDNFWQMADTGPCGPCSEIFIDLSKCVGWRPGPDDRGEWTELDRAEFSTEAFVEGTERGRFLEFWNLVFMQFDRQPDGTLVPLPKPSVDTGAGLERVTSFMQGRTNVFHIDVFEPMVRAVENVTGWKYTGYESLEPREQQFRPGSGAQSRSAAARGDRLLVDPAAFHVLADHARTVAFLIADGVNPSNEGRGYVLRRILRRAVRYAYLLGRIEPTLVEVVETVVRSMGDAYPELRAREKLILTTVREEEKRFLTTIEAGMSRFDEIAPAHTTQGGDDVRGTISGEDAFRLYDTFGFPIDLTELMARERGYTVDIAGFEAALDAQRRQSQEERKSRKLGVAADALADLSQWERDQAVAKDPSDEGDTRFVGYDTVEIETQVTAVRRLEGNRVAVMLRETPFYAESGGQVSDRGEIVGDGWRVDVDDVRRIEGRIAAVGELSGELHFGPAVARVPGEPRKDTERNHTATHLLHAALRHTLGEHVHQAGSLVAPDRLRFDFTHHGPVGAENLERIEEQVNREIFRATPVHTEQKAYKDALAQGAMALFGEKYGDVVRVVSVPGYSTELCGGTHVRNTAEIGLFTIVQETGVAAGVRRIEALTGPGAYRHLREQQRTLQRLAEQLRAPVDQVSRRVQTLVEERRQLERRLEEARRGGGGPLQSLVSRATDVGGVKVVAAQVPAADVKELQAMGDALREQLGSGVGVLAASFPDGKNSLLVVVTDDLRERGVRADALIKDVAAAAGGRGGGKPHMAQAGVPDAARIPGALERVPALVAPALGVGAR
jgi:alanyl-tRNA synthetase